MAGMNALEFLHFLYGGVSDFHLQVTYLHPQTHHIISQSAPLPQDFLALDPALPKIHAYNQRGYSVHFCVPLRLRAITGWERGTEADSGYVTALWADVDDNSDAAFNRLKNTEPWPSVIVSSGGGYHAYWKLVEPVFLDGIQRPMVKKTLKGLALFFQTDTQVADLARMMRLPGTVNTKPGRAGAECVVANDWDGTPPSYHYHELEMLFAPLVKGPVYRPSKRQYPLGEKRIPRRVEAYLAGGAVKGERNRELFKNACRLLAVGFQDWEVANLLTARAQADGLDTKREIPATLRSAARKVGVVTGGFVTPRHLRNFMSGEDSHE